MARIKTIPIEESTGLLKKIYDDGIKRAGFVSQILQIMSINPQTLRSSIMIYSSIMFGESEITRVQKELIATVVATELQCLYWIRAHSHDLREEIGKIIESKDEADNFVNTAVSNWEDLDISKAEIELLKFSVKLTHSQHEIDDNDIMKLREMGFSDLAIHDAVQVVSYFNYITRIASGLGADPIDYPTKWGGI